MSTNVEEVDPITDAEKREFGDDTSETALCPSCRRRYVKVLQDGKELFPWHATGDWPRSWCRWSGRPVPATPEVP